MPKPFLIDRPYHLTISLPQSVFARLSLHLHSDLEGRVPQGAYQKFFLARIEEYFQRLEKGTPE